MKVRAWKFVAVMTMVSFTHVAFSASAEAPASEASIKELMNVMQTSKLLDNISVQLDNAMQVSMQQALAGKQVSPEQQKILDDMRPKMVKLIADSLQWDQLEPVFIDIYERTFSQAEVEGMIVFYKSKSGRALVAKMPLAMQNSMQAMQSRTAQLMPKLQQLQQEAIEQLKAAKSE